MADYEYQRANATRTVCLLEGQADQLRNELIKMRRELTGAQRELANAQRDLERVRLELIASQRTLQFTQQDLSKARRALAKTEQSVKANQTAQLQEVNEQLLIAALKAEALAETAVANLDELARVSQRDPLTDTPNRTLMLDRVETAISTAKRRGTHLAIFFLDIDNFKSINDSFGHSVGDAVVQLFARRLEEVVRDSDTVSRHGGDEFLVLISDLTQIPDVALIAVKMLAALSRPTFIEGHELELSASIGIAVYPEDGTDSLTLISRADAAMYASKRAGSGSFEFYRSIKEES